MRIFINFIQIETSKMINPKYFEFNILNHDRYTNYFPKTKYSQKTNQDRTIHYKKIIIICLICIITMLNFGYYGKYRTPWCYIYIIYTIIHINIIWSISLIYYFLYLLQHILAFFFISTNRQTGVFFYI